MKLALTLTSVLASLGLAGFWPDDPEPAAPPPPPQAPEAPKDVVKRVEVRVNAADDQDSSTDDALGDAYNLLSKLRAERPAPEGRSQEMIERATDLYRRAVKAAGGREPGRAMESHGLAVAARETARAAERLREVQRGDRPPAPDPELPPPPRRAAVRREMVKVAPLPPIPPALPGGHPIPPVPPVPPAAGRVFVGPDRRAPGRSFVFVTPHGDMVKDGDGKAIRKFEVRVDEKGIREMEAQIREHAADIVRQVHAQEGQARGQADKARANFEEMRAEAEKVREEALKSAHAARIDAFAIGHRGGPGPAREELQKAYERIRQAREQARGDEAKFYLDAARDLYNAARRDAEAGRNDRAVELARAAEALTHVPAHLGAIKEAREADDENEPAEDDDTDRPRRERIERREIRRSERPSADDRGREGRKEDDDDDDDDDEDNDHERKKIEIRIERKAEEAAHDEAEQGEKKVAGIGAALKIEDGKVIVLKVLPDSPAGQDGRLKPDDVLVGVLGDDGETTEFEGQELIEIVKALRGPAGSEVRLLVRPAGEDEVSVYKLTRAELNTSPGALEPVREDINRAVQNVFEELRGGSDDGQPAAGSDRLPPPLPE